MSILSTNSKRMLVESMRKYMRGILMESSTLTSKQATDRIGFLCENATYEQLLNITLNPSRDTHYLPSYVLEGAVAILHRACLTGRRKIGVNAITEGALKLHKETGAVITESMLDAALNAVNNGSGLKIVGKILTEAPSADATTLTTLINDQIQKYKLGTPAEKSVALNAIADKIKQLPGLDNGVKRQMVDALARNPDNMGQIMRQAVNISAMYDPSTATKYGMQKFSRYAARKGTDNVKSQIMATLTGNAARTVSPNSAQAAADSIIQQARNRGGSGWKTAGILAGGAALLGTGAMLYNRYKKNQAAAQQAQQ